MSKEAIDQWMFRVMEIRKEPSSATIEEIHRLASEYIYSSFCTGAKHHIAEIGQILTSQTDTYNHGES